MRFFWSALLILILVIIGIVTFANSAFSDYHACIFELPLGVTNTGDTDFTNVRIQYNLNPASLIALGSMDADADGTYLQDGSTALDHVATGLSGTVSAATWTGLLGSIEGLGYKELILYMGEPSPPVRDQAWLGQYNDYTWALDSPTLDFTTNFLLSCDIELYHYPNTGSPNTRIISKAGNYELVVDDTPDYVFSVWTGTGAVVNNGICEPESRGYYTNLPLASSIGVGHWSLVASGTDTTWVGVNSGSEAQDSYKTSVTYGSNITSDIDVYYRIGLDGGSGTANAIPFLYSGPTGIVWGTTQSVPSAFTDYNEVIPWSGGSDFEIGIKLISDSGSDPKCSRMYAITDWESPGVQTSVHIAATVGTELSLSAWYDGSDIYITDGITNSSSPPASASCYVNDNPVHVLEVDAKVDNLSIVTP